MFDRSDHVNIEKAITAITSSKRSVFTLAVLSGNVEAVKWTATLIKQTLDEKKVGVTYVRCCSVHRLCEYLIALKHHG